MSAWGPSQFGVSPQKKSQMNHVIVLFRRFFYWHMTHGMSGPWQCPFLKPQVVAVTAGCQIERLRHGGAGAWTSPPGHWAESAFQTNRAQGHRKYQTEGSIWSHTAPGVETSGRFWEKAGSSSTMFKCILGKFQCKKLSNILPGHGQDLRMAIGARFCANRSNNFQHCPCKDTAWKSLETYLLSTVW